MPTPRPRKHESQQTSCELEARNRSGCVFGLGLETTRKGPDLIGGSYLGGECLLRFGFSLGVPARRAWIWSAPQGPCWSMLLDASTHSSSRQRGPPTYRIVVGVLQGLGFQPLCLRPLGFGPSLCAAVKSSAGNTWNKPTRSSAPCRICHACWEFVNCTGNATS